MKKILSTAKCGPALSACSERSRTAAKGFINPISLINLGILVIGLAAAAVIVKNPDKLDIRTQAASGKTCRALRGSCVPNSYVCNKGSYTMDCTSGNKCGYGTCKPAPKPTPTPTVKPTPGPSPQTGLCSPACKTDEICSPTPYGYYCQKKSLVTMPDGAAKCDANTLMVMKNGGWVKDKVCQYGCAYNTCKPPPAAPTIPESIDDSRDTLPLPLAAINPPNDPLSLTQDPIMAATLTSKILDCFKGFSQSQCTKAFRKAANTKDTCVAFYLLEDPNADVKQTADRCNGERGNAVLMAAAVAAGAYGISAVGPANALRIANVVDDVATITACANGDQNACAFVTAAIINPVPGMSLASQLTDDITALTKNFEPAAQLSAQRRLNDYIKYYQSLPPQGSNLFPKGFAPQNLYPFQKEVLDLSTAGYRPPVYSIVRNAATQAGADVLMLSPSEHAYFQKNLLAGKDSGELINNLLAWRRAGIDISYIQPLSSKYEPMDNTALFVPSLNTLVLPRSDTALNLRISESEFFETMLHEGGHAVDNFYGMSTWQTEIRQQYFSGLWSNIINPGSYEAAVDRAFLQLLGFTLP